MNKRNKALSKRAAIKKNNTNEENKSTEKIAPFNKIDNKYL